MIKTKIQHQKKKTLKAKDTTFAQWVGKKLELRRDSKGKQFPTFIGQCKPDNCLKSDLANTYHKP